MTLSIGKKELASLVEVLEADHETVEDAAKAVMAEAEEIFKARAKYVVVGQVQATKDGGKLRATDPRAVKVSLGWYSTEGDARKAAEGLWSSTAGGDTFRAWWLPVFHGTPAEFHKETREKYEKESEKSGTKEKERFQESIRKRAEEADARAKELRTPCKCKCEKSAHGQGKDSACRTIHCGCPAFKELK